WVINFGTMSEEEAREYPEPFEIVERDVKPVRAKNKRAPRREYWWRFAERAPELYGAISGLDRVLVIARVSKTAQPVFVDAGSVMSEQVVVFARSSFDYLAFLASSHHYLWAVYRSSSMKGDLRYAPSDCFETFPLPGKRDNVFEVGGLLHQERREIMLRRGLRSEEHTSELQSRFDLVCRLLLEKKNSRDKIQLHHDETMRTINDAHVKPYET